MLVAIYISKELHQSIGANIFFLQTIKLESIFQCSNVAFLYKFTLNKHSLQKKNVLLFIFFFKQSCQKREFEASKEFIIDILFSRLGSSSTFLERVGSGAKCQNADPQYRLFLYASVSVNGSVKVLSAPVLGMKEAKTSPGKFLDPRLFMYSFLLRFY